MRSPLTETIKRVEGMIAYVRENLDEDEYDLFLDLILPEPEPVRAAKRGRKKSSKGGSKSSRASGMAATIKDSLEKGRQAAIQDPACSFRYKDDTYCTLPESSPVHDPEGGYAGYHPFVSTAQPARGKSSTNGGAGSTTASSEADRENVSTATGG